MFYRQIALYFYVPDNQIAFFTESKELETLSRYHNSFFFLFTGKFYCYYPTNILVLSWYFLSSFLVLSCYFPFIYPILLVISLYSTCSSLVLSLCLPSSFFFLYPDTLNDFFPHLFSSL